MSEPVGGLEDMQDILHEFVVDSKEMLEDTEPLLVELEEAYSEEKINNVFRCFHSIKGGAGFLNLNSIQKLTHSAETLLDLFRKGKLEFASEHLDIMVSVCDQISTILDKVDTELTDEGFENNIDAICLDIDDAISGKKPTTKSQAKVSPPPVKKLDETATPVAEDEFEIPITEEMINQFVQEAESGFEKIEEILLILEKFGFEQKLLDDAYRLIHSFKGNCGFLNFKDLEKISHRVETVFDGMKNKEVPTTEDNVTVLFSALDILRSTTQQIAGSGSAEIPSCAAVLGLLDNVIPEEAVNLKQKVEAIQEPVLKEKPVVSPEQVISLAEEEMPKPSESARLVKTEEDKAVSKSLQTDIRVNLQKVDTVINLVGELMIVSQMITSNLEGDSEKINRSSQQLNSLITELQDVAMSIRMIPLAGTFRKMVRLVRDLSKKSGKRVQFETRGEDTELDKTVVEQISDPLVHLVRNAIDHGIEPPEEREAQGKPATGKLIIEAKYEGNEVWINIIDDGRGMHRDKILAKAKERNLVTDEANEWPDSKIYKLIFEPGFSTADKVTSVSGRGVGMDVVKRNIEKVKGHVDIKCVPGQGSTLGLRIPLTLAIIDGMLLRVGDSIYTAPLLAIRESVQIKPSQVTIVDRKEVVMVREQLIPVFRLHKLHNITPQYNNLEDGILIILEYQDDVFGLFVDELLGQYQTVIKGLSDYFGKVSGISGCSILSNGEVSLILDVADLRNEIDDSIN
ncbi:chemotaxis protein CheA [bacterium]|nr:chemotaxis protein CheA [bacterium]